MNRAVVIALAIILCPSSWAGTKPGDHVPLPDSEFTVSGSGISVEEVANSLTDINGLLRSIHVQNQGRVSFDRPEPLVEGNHIAIPFTYHELGGHHSDGGGTLSSSEYSGCGAGARGKQLVLVTDPPKNSSDKVHVSQTVFQVCARSSGDGVHVHVSAYMVAGPDWSGKALEVSKVIFAKLDSEFQQHALSYAGKAVASSSSSSSKESALLDDRVVWNVGSGAADLGASQ